MFIGYASGSLVLGAISFVFKTADTLSFACVFIMIAGSFLNFIVLKEPPRFLFKNGRVSDGFKALSHIAKVNEADFSDEQLLEVMDYPKSEAGSPYEKQLVMKLPKEERTFYDSIQPLLNWESIYSIIGLVSVSSLLYIVFYVSSVSVSDSLGLSKIQYNEMLLGLTHIIGYCAMIPFLHKIRRVKTAAMMLLADLVLGSFLLLITAMKLDRNGGALEGSPYKVINVTCAVIINILNSACFCVFFAHAAELFDVRVRGIGVGMATLIGKLMGSLSP
jgi:hypothetical protein